MRQNVKISLFLSIQILYSGRLSDLCNNHIYSGLFTFLMIMSYKVIANLVFAIKEDFNIIIHMSFDAFILFR